MLKIEEASQRAVSLAPRYLNTDLQSGLFFASARGGVFLICEADATTKWAVMISDPKFRAWRLLKDAQHWQGIFVPDVEILVEPGEFSQGPRRDPQPGDLVLAEGVVGILSTPENAMWPQPIRWADSELDQEVVHPPMSFSRWSVARRDPSGRYERLVSYGFTDNDLDRGL